MSYTPDSQWIRLTALGVFVVATLTDALDGFVARAYNQKTRLGAVLDPLADKLLINLAFVFLAVNQEFRFSVPPWFPVVVLFRDAVIVMGAYVINEYFGPVRVRPRILGKMTTAIQMAYIISVLLDIRLAAWLLWAALGISIMSFLDYVYEGIRQVGNEDSSQ